jgi:hypothetical protein
VIILHAQLHSPRSAFRAHAYTDDDGGTPAVSNAILARSASTLVG